MLLELVVPGFSVIEGQTFQVPIGLGRSVDFLIDGVLVEYHEERLCELRARRRRSRRRHDAGESGLQQYAARRRAALDENPRFAGTELIVTTSVAEFYHRVIGRFAPLHRPTQREFEELFWAIVKHVARESRKERHRFQQRKRA